MELLINKKAIAYIDFKDRESTIFIQFIDGKNTANLTFKSKEAYLETKKILTTVIYSHKEFLCIDNSKDLN